MDTIVKRQQTHVVTAQLEIGGGATGSTDAERLHPATIAQRFATRGLHLARRYDWPPSELAN